MSVDADAILEHFGVKGMRWGQRNSRVVKQEQGRDITKGDLKWKRETTSLNNYLKIHNKMADGVNSEISAFNKKYEGKDLGYDRARNTYNTAAGKKYLKEFEEISQKHAQNAAKEIFKDSPSGNWTANITYTVDTGLQVYIDPKEATHSAVEISDKGLVFTFNVEVDEAGFIKSISEKKVEQTSMVDDFLEHFGVRGMKWGVRKTRSGVENKAIAKRKKAATNRRTISDKDLDAFINRIQKEKRLKDLVNEDTSPGKTAAKLILSETGKKVTRTVISGAALLVVKKVVDKKFGEGAGSIVARGGIGKK